MIHELKTCGLRWDVEQFGVNCTHRVASVNCYDLIHNYYFIPSDMFSHHKSIQHVWYCY